MHFSIDEEEGKVPEEIEDNHFLDLLSERDLVEEIDEVESKNGKLDFDAFSTNRLDTQDKLDVEII
jgi:hypothetical protein